MINRRQFLGLSAAGIGVVFSSGCGDIFGPAGDPRLSARPRGEPPHPPLEPGTYALNLGAPRDGILLVPTSVQGNEPVPLMVFLHGAGGDRNEGLAVYSGLAQSLGMLLLVPESRGVTWDAVRDKKYAHDVDYINRALEFVFESFRIDRSLVGVAGFSNGASYALGLGLSNGDLFTHVLAFSPGSMPERDSEGKPRVFVSHGSNDEVLIVDGSRELVAELRDDGYDVEYLEFTGGHRIPGAVISAANQWLLQD